MITWKCHICKRERPDAAISVLQKDTSAEYSLPVGSMKQNVRYCNDNKECIVAVPTFSFPAKQ